MPWNLHASLVRGPTSLDIGPKRHCKAAQMYLLSAGTAPSTMLYGTMPWNLHAPLVQGPLSLDIGPPEWHSKAAQMSLISTSTAPFSML